MDWLAQNWQTVAALGVVGATLVVFAVRILRPKKAPGCGEGCGCGKKAASPGEGGEASR